MPRYVIERTFPQGLILPMDETGAEICRTVVNNNAQDQVTWILRIVVDDCAQDQVTWIHSYVSEDKRKSFCIYDAPSPEAIRQAARRSQLPVDRITEVRVLDPYFYTYSN